MKRRMTCRFAAPVSMICACAIAIGAARPVPPALEEMAAAERAFAKRAGEASVRQAFLEFLADEAVSFEPDPGPARERLAASTRQPPAGFQLLWEPRLGDVAESGDLGYLTCPAESLVPGQPARTSNYFSIWRRQANGTFRVIIDLGISTPGKPPFAPGLSHADARATWKGRADREAAERSLAAADKALAASLASNTPREAYAAALAPSARVLRNDVMPMTPAEAGSWLARGAASMSAEPMKAEAAASGELGYTWGRFSITGPTGTARTGYYVRVWTRQADGGWKIVVDVTT